MTPQEVSLIFFQETVNPRYFELFKMLVEKGVFETKCGSVEIHFDLQGNIRKVVRHAEL